MRIIPTRLHAVGDYVIGILLIAAPWLFQFAAGGAETWVPVLLGAGIILYSLFTAYELGVVPTIGMPTHLALDFSGGVFLALSPWIFQFDHVVWVPHVVVGLLEIGSAMMTERTPAHVPHRTGRPGPTGTR